MARLANRLARHTERISLLGQASASLQMCEILHNLSLGRISASSHPSRSDSSPSPRTTPQRNSDPNDASLRAPAEPQPRSRAELALAQVSPVFVRVHATGRTEGRDPSTSNPVPGHSPPPQHPVTHPVLNSAQDHSPVTIPAPETPPPASFTAQVHSPASQQESHGLKFVQVSRSTPTKRHPLCP